jgi:hypothetical protein
MRMIIITHTRFSQQKKTNNGINLLNSSFFLTKKRVKHQAFCGDILRRVYHKLNNKIFDK